MSTLIDDRVRVIEGVIYKFTSRKRAAIHVGSGRARWIDDKTIIFKTVGAALKAITENDPDWREKLQANPWRPLPSNGYTVLQIDTRPGLCRKSDQPETVTNVIAS